jgi:hypothetical protein
LPECCRRREQRHTQSTNEREHAFHWTSKPGRTGRLQRLYLP